MLTKSTIWLEETGIKIPAKEIITDPRIVVDYAEEHALLPWRFLVKHIPD